jgi:hypothetical protein
LLDTPPTEKPKTPDEEDLLVPVDRWRFYREVEKRTIWEPDVFERIISWSFSMGDAPKSKKELAWALMNLPKSEQRKAQAVRDAFPAMWIGSIADVAAVLELAGALGDQTAA